MNEESTVDLTSSLTYYIHISIQWVNPNLRDNETE